MQYLEVSGAVRPLQWSLGVKGLIACHVETSKRGGLGPNFVCSVAGKKGLNFFFNVLQRTGVVTSYIISCT